MTDAAEQAISCIGEEIMAIGAWANNAQLIHDAAKLGYVESPVLDLTYGEGKFWSSYEPIGLVTNDLHKDADYHHDFRDTPFGSRDFATVVFDPPYKLAGKRFGDDIDQRYGIATYTSRADVTALIDAGCREAARISSRWVLVKVQDQVSGGIVRWQTDDVRDVMVSEGFEKRDVLMLKRWRPQPKGRRQNTARRNYSSLLVFER